MISGVYYANWTVYSGCEPIDLPYTKLTHLYYAFFNIDPVNGCVVHSDQYADLEKPIRDPLDPLNQVSGVIKQCRALKKLNPDLKLIMSVGGYAQGGNFNSLIDQGLCKLDKFVDSIVEKADSLGFDGVDVDYEFPDTLGRMRGFSDLLGKLRVKSDKLLITTAVPVSNEFLDRLIPEIYPSVDLWNVMCYDFVGEWSPTTGYHSNVYSRDRNNPNEYSTWNALTNYINKGIEPEKLVVGMPLYGRVFRGCHTPKIGVPFNNGQHNPGTIGEPICNYHQLPLGKEYKAMDVGGCFCYQAELQQLITYDTVEIVLMKVEIIRLLGLGGGFFWEASGDSKDHQLSLIHAFVSAIKR